MMSNRFDMDEELSCLDYPFQLFSSRRNEHDTTFSETLTETDTDDMMDQLRGVEPDGVVSRIEWGPDGFMAPRLSYKDRTFQVLTRPITQLPDSSMWTNFFDGKPSKQFTGDGERLRSYLSVSESGLWDAFTKDTAIALDDVLRSDQFDEGVQSHLFATRRASRSNSVPKGRASCPLPYPSGTRPHLEPFPFRSRSFPTHALEHALSQRRFDRSRSPAHVNTYEEDYVSTTFVDQPSVDTYFPAGTSVMTATLATTTKVPSSPSTRPPSSATRLQSNKVAAAEESPDIALIPELLGPVKKGPQPHHLFIPSWVYAARTRDTEVFDNSIYYYFQHNRWPTYGELPERFQIDCEQTNTAPDAYHKTAEGFAPVWMFVLNRMGEEKPAFRTWFSGCIAGFFDDGSYPPSFMFPKELATLCTHLGINEDDFYEEEGFPEY